MAERAGEVSALLKTLAHPARLMIVCTLIEGERSVGELEEAIDVHQPTLSQQLTVLRGAGIVRTRRASKQIFYRLTEAKAAKLIDALYAIYCAEAKAPARARRKKAETAS
ncbi:MAG TPA: sulfite-sensing transcriptional repressor BigR [Acetobacteraceae bacterium]|nr:sulfite-sensing transcriptional repressor BigR [Acetobacteraceae bacterium]